MHLKPLVVGSFYFCRVVGSLLVFECFFFLKPFYLLQKTAFQPLRANPCWQMEKKYLLSLTISVTSRGWRIQWSIVPEVSEPVVSL